MIVLYGYNPGRPVLHIESHEDELPQGESPPDYRFTAPQARDTPAARPARHSFLMVPIQSKQRNPTFHIDITYMVFGFLRYLHPFSDLPILPSSHRFPCFPWFPLLFSRLTLFFLGSECLFSRFGVSSLPPRKQPKTKQPSTQPVT